MKWLPSVQVEHLARLATRVSHQSPSLDVASQGEDSTVQSVSDHTCCMSELACKEQLSRPPTTLDPAGVSEIRSGSASRGSDVSAQKMHPDRKALSWDGPKPAACPSWRAESGSAGRWQSWTPAGGPLRPDLNIAQGLGVFSHQLKCILTTRPCHAICMMHSMPCDGIAAAAYLNWPEKAAEQVAGNPGAPAGGVLRPYLYIVEVKYECLHDLVLG